MRVARCLRLIRLPNLLGNAGMVRIEGVAVSAGVGWGLILLLITTPLRQDCWSITFHETESPGPLSANIIR